MRKYVDMDSPVEMIVAMFRMLSLKDAIVALEKITIVLYNKKLGAENFSEIVYNEETSPKNYAEVISCFTCKSHNISKNGKDRNGVQRYKCKECEHTFSATSNTLSSYTSQSVGQWMTFIIGLFNCETCEVLSKKCGISVPTAHEWRLKVFAALEHLEKDVKLTNVIMADDTRLPYSFKGNHGENFDVPRKQHKRGKQNTRKNNNNNTVCILCAVDSDGHSFSRFIGFGNPSGKRISEGFKDKLEVKEDTILVTDGAKCFSRAIKDYNIPSWNRNTTLKYKSKKYPNIIGELHIQGVNSYHSRLKHFISRFRGVASRYLPGYIILFDYMQNNKDMSQEEMAIKVVKAMTEVTTNITMSDLEARFRTPVSNGPETELWEKRVPQKEQKIYIDYCNEMSIKEVCEKHKITRRKLYYIKEKVDKYGLHDKIMLQKKERKQRVLLPISDKNWNMFLKCYRDGESYASVAREYSVSRQHVHQTVTTILKRPESMTVKKYTKPQKTKEQTLKETDVYRDFKNMYMENSCVKELYEVLSVKYNKSPGTIENYIISQRQRDDLIRPHHKWREERKTLCLEEYNNYLENRNKQICDEIDALLVGNHNISKKTIYEKIALKYGFSISHITKIYHDNRQPVNVYSTTEKYDFICNLFLLKEDWCPELKQKEVIQSIAHDLNISLCEVEKIYYKNRKPYAAGAKSGVGAN